jgi:D-alanyl-D-alanine carboxypeptidase/D-alanyl-D-alanine-endopeptidase (penicillin-binding protein 4)
LKFGFLAIGLFATASVLQAADTGLPLSVQSALNARKLPHDSLSVYVSDVDTGEVVLKWLDEQPRNPASTIKLLTTLVALDVLGPAYRWRTDVFVDGELKDGRLNGDLMLKGYGDPFLVTERVWQLLRLIRQKGIQEISGDLRLDDGWFEIGDYDPAAFDRQPLRAYNVAPNALMMNFKVIRYLFEPDLAGGSVDVTMDPALDNVSIENRLGLANSSCRGYQRGITITTNASDDEVTFSGRFPNGCKRYAMDRTALSHNEFVYGLFASLWRESGGSIDGGWKNTVIEEDKEPLLSFDSRPHTEMIALINKHSNNVMARQLMYTLGAEVNGPPGTEDSGKAVIEKWLADEGLDSTEIAIENGAGLSRNTRTTARDMSAMLEFAWRQPYMPEYLASMSLSGLDGTLRRRFRDTNLVGKAHLKTGSLDHVTAIAGFLQSRSGRRFTVVAMQSFEDIHRGPGEEVQEALLRWLYEQ